MMCCFVELKSDLLQLTECLPEENHVVPGSHALNFELVLHVCLFRIQFQLQGRIIWNNVLPKTVLH